MVNIIPCLYPAALFLLLAIVNIERINDAYCNICANSGEHNENNNQCQECNHFKKFLSASACLPFSTLRISAESIA